MEILGVKRSAEELIPMLTELYDKIDNNIELMGCLAVHLGKLTEKLGAYHCISLIGPLELLAGADDAVVW